MLGATPDAGHLSRLRADDYRRSFGSNGYQLTTVTSWQMMSLLGTRERGSGMHTQQQTATESGTAMRQFYASESQLTALGRHAAIVRDLPDDLNELVKIIQGLVIYDAVASDFYGCELSEERQQAIHIRPIEEVIDGIFALDERPLSVARPPERRLAGRCHHYARLLVAMLRAKGVPARLRCGFGAYFAPDSFEDHVVCEYWNDDDSRWVLVDAQLDGVFRERLGFKYDHLDVPRDQFIVAAEAWDRCRTGSANPERFGISFAGFRGLWFVATALLRDVAALNKVEVLPWDVWGAHPQPGHMLSEGELAFFDEVAALTRDPDKTFGELRECYLSDDRLLVPEIIFNSILGRSEAI
jgi:hypothetical protein